MSSIEWTDVTWNPIVGCNVISPGCKNCYAMRFAWRLAHNPKMADKYKGTVRLVKGRPVWTGRLNFDEAALRTPFTWRKPRPVFVNSMSDLFHERLPDHVIDRVFAIMALCPQHQFQILTKRPARMREYMSAGVANRIGAAMTSEFGWTPAAIDRVKAMPLPNVWLGVSVEDQRRADERIPDLLATPAAIRFVSCEPLLGPVDVSRIRRFVEASPHEFLDALRGRWFTEGAGDPEQMSGILWPVAKIDLVIAGGESGPGARPSHPDWHRALRDQCSRARVAFFFKQWGAWVPSAEIGFYGHESKPTHTMAPYEMMLIGKKAAGRVLDGRTWDEMPRSLS